MRHSGQSLSHSVSGWVLAIALSHAGAAAAQARDPASNGAKTPDAGSPPASAVSEVVVTATRIERAGFEAPTPVTVLGPVDIRQGDRPDIVQLLDDQTQFRGTTTPVTTPANTNSGAALVDLRGLGSERTLVLLDSHRTISGNDLNSIPIDLVKRIDVVTGGASADWGSGAVAGVVNIILDDDLVGGSVGGGGGESSRGDAERYQFSASYGTRFAQDRGHIMVAAEYLKDDGAFGRASGNRPNLDSGLFTSSSGQVSLQHNVNAIYATPGGLIQNGPLAGEVFNSNGTLSPFVPGSQTAGYYTVGGNGVSDTNYYAVSAPYERYNIYARASYNITPDVKLWADVNFSRIHANYPFFPEYAGVTISADNAYLPASVKAALGGTGGFQLGKFLTDIGPQGYFSFAYHRDIKEGAIGIDGAFGSGWKYSIYYDHGEYTDDEQPHNQRIVANFNNAVDAVISPTTGQPVCRIALTNPSTNCVPINLLGTGNVSAAAVAYAFGGAEQTLVGTLDTGGISLRGDLFSTWAGPISVATGFEARREGVATTYIDPLSPTDAFSLDNRKPINGSFTVEEGFAETVVPLLNLEGVAVVDFNGAARYSNYSTSGGIWSWKTGGTARLFNDVRLRAVYSRDIRSPDIGELYNTQTINQPTVLDPFKGNNPVMIIEYTGGNPNLKPEIANTLTFGGSYEPSRLRGLSLSVDYYSIDINGVIASISAQDALNQCFAGNQAACATIVRDGEGNITAIYGTSVNLAYYKTSGVDFEAAYRYALPNSAGDLRFRGLASYVDRLIINDGVNTYNRAGDVGDDASFTTPKWRATGSVTYEKGPLNVDVRVRFVGGGKFDHLEPIINNDVASRTYVDLGAQYKLGRVLIYASIDNLFDRDPPYVTYTSAIYDVIGRYFSGGVKMKF
jgi:outer membrane receptor protein involved in Fe transport